MTANVENKLSALVARVGRVRFWLVALSVLKVAALSLVFVSVYVGIYAWLDHRFHFGEYSRIIAFVLLVGGVVFLLYRLVRQLCGHISYSSAANYIESKENFDQQLVTAIEYYEKKQDYPYSEALAEHLVLQVDRASADLRFDSTVAKWLGYVLAAIILFGVGMVGFYLHDNYVYFSSYLARLFKPLAVVEPLPATSLSAITGDIVAEPSSVVRFTAGIKGRIPEVGRFVLSASEPNGIDGAEGELFEISPVLEEDKEPRFEMVRSFDEACRLMYRFEAGQAYSPWHTVRICSMPKIKSIKADITLGHNKYVRPYSEDVNDFSLEVLKGSFVTLTVEASESLSGAVVKDLSGATEQQDIDGTAKFTHKFIAERKGFIEFELSSVEGVTNNSIPSLQVMIKVDEPPKLKLVSPDGDYLATSVSSVPLTFEATDDFGLSGASLTIEFPGKEPVVLTMPVENGVKNKKFTHTLELDDYELSVGDSIMFHASARDINTGLSLVNSGSQSDVYFIEVRPYRQRWHQMQTGLPSRPGKQGMPRDERLEKLKSILEYTRAIVKKTWAISSKAELTDKDKSNLGYINDDVQYCNKHVTGVRDKIFAGDEESQAKLTKILGHYEASSKYLAWNKASSALVSEKDAYRDLRKFVIELEKALPGSGSPPKTRDKVKMEEKVHVTRFEKERIQWELDRLGQRLAKIISEQKRLKKDFENFLRQQEQKKTLAQKMSDEKKWISKEMPSEGRPCSSCGSEEPGGCPSCTLEPTVEGALKPPKKMEAGPDNKEAKKSAGKGKGSGSGSGGGGGNAAAGVKEQLAMLQARQRALKAQVAQLKESLQRVPGLSPADNKSEADTRKKAEEHLDEAMAQMDNFEYKLAQAYYKAETDDRKLKEAVAAMEQAYRELDNAQELLEKEMDLSPEQLLVLKAEKTAEQLIELAEAIEGSDSEVDQEEVLSRLKDAERALESMSQQAQMSQAGNAGQTGHLGHGAGEGGQGNTQYSPAGASVSPGSSSGGGQGKNPAHAARALARQFWSIAIQVKKREGQMLPDEASDVKFYELESDFFEDAAKYKGQGVGK